MVWRRALAALLAAGGLAACGGGGAGDGNRVREENPPAVEAVQARSGALPLEERVTGVVRAENQVGVRPEISAPIVEVLVRSGASVRRGPPLVRLDDGTLQEQLRQAEASVRLEEASAKAARARVAELAAQLTRARQLAAQALVSRLELETLEAQSAAAVANADQADAVPPGTHGRRRSRRPGVNQVN
jgi:HlyD family secretion protein